MCDLAPDYHLAHPISTSLNIPGCVLDYPGVILNWVFQGLLTLCLQYSFLDFSEDNSFLLSIYSNLTFLINYSENSLVVITSSKISAWFSIALSLLLAVVTVQLPVSYVTTLTVLTVLKQFQLH